MVEFVILLSPGRGDGNLNSVLHVCYTAYVPFDSFGAKESDLSISKYLV